MRYFYSQTAVPLRSGVKRLNPQPVSFPITGVTVRIPRCTSKTYMYWESAATKVTVDIKYSLDNEATWVSGGSFSDTGGIRVVDGLEVEESVALLPFDEQPTNVRIIITVDNGPAFGTIFVEANEP